ncbi:MAG TPA: helix-turn-helix domain-containing protein, partial [Candidatus Coprenecus stercoravium]|nr:helix-turn-helix domain-containing protein [Candidatus Coprenecus stercoravium]
QRLPRSHPEHPSPVDINILNITFLHPVIQLRKDRATRLLEYYDFIEKRNNDTGNAYHEEISKTLLYALMLEISDIYRNISGDRSEVTKPRQEQLTDDFFRLLTAHYRSEHNVAFYAGRLNRTPKYFSEAIRRISGRSVSDWIATMLLSDSKLLLQTTDMTILEISEELGFSSPSVFVQFFRHHTGTTPLQYRKQL